ncbi:hypothetical protein BCR37DRAFT_380530 [Protomyces lactucae-debilis]|uniref:Eukaryotic translation initiation factor 3 subunit A n=1 Tax=Protomyces lactucae-debilis TaxID=2754530 RepID=A0A1Y2FAX8_PROLT|nr:uncharacterized protein BCR37DRAFT_380530 [Protomyces lactucae-debilis]ORY80787.1 hypothetical protein BCR37DRAFT_380530 [Protomyces lactucae-debilis]
MAPMIQKPENVLKRAEELVGVGQQAAALQSLHELIISKRSKSASIASLEPLMLRLVELAVEQRKGKIVKESLYQYKNIAQNTSVETLVVVVNRFIKLSQQKFAEAQQQAEKLSLEAIDDLEATETPESILLSTVTADVGKDRTDRAVVTPWLRFLWETYRTVLDILRNNGRLEQTYQDVTHQAFDFCQKFERKMEFRRLCDLLRNHLQNAAKYTNSANGINLNDPDTLQRHLDSRFVQLNTAVAMELWQEAFRSVEDIHNLLTISKRPAKPAVMANYYEKLSKIFLVSGNYLFHAAAFNKYATLVRTQNKGASAAELERLGSTALLSAIAIPVMRDQQGRGVELDLDDHKTKHARLAALLNMPHAPTRAGLLKEALHKNARVQEHIKAVYVALETQFHPLSICQRISPLLEKLATPEFQGYIQPLQQVVLVRVFQQLSQVYETVSFDFITKLISFPAQYAIDAVALEKFIMAGCKKGELHIRIDHANNCLTFEADNMLEQTALPTASRSLQPSPADLVKSQLTRLARCLYATLSHVDPAFVEEKAALKRALLARAAEHAEQEHAQVLARTSIIERRKELVQTAQMKKDQEEASRRELQRQKEQEAESRRVAEDTRRRELERIKREQDKIKQDESKKLREELKASGALAGVDEAELESLDTTKLRAMQLQQLEKSTKDINERMRITAKRIDHLERAYRRAEMPLVQKDAEEQVKADKENHAARSKAALETAQVKHEEALRMKKRMSRVLPDFDVYRQQLAAKREVAYKQRVEEAQRKLDEEKEARRVAYRKEVAEEEAREREEQERYEREEAEHREAEKRHEQEAAERAEKEEAQRAEREKKAAEQAERMKKLDEQAAKQRAREEEAEAKLRAKKEGRPVPGAAAPAASAGGDNVYRPGQGKWSRGGGAAGAGGDRAGATGGMGERSASYGRRETPVPSREQTPRASEDGAKPSKGAYVPMHLRKGPDGNPPTERRASGW